MRIRKIFFLAMLLSSLLLNSCKNDEERTLLDAVPLNSSIILEVDGLHDFVTTSTAKSYIKELKTLTSSAGLGLMIETLDSIFVDDKEYYDKIMSNKAAFAMCHEKGKTERLLLIGFDKSLNEKTIKGKAKAKNLIINENVADGVNLMTVSMNNDVFFLAVKDGLISMSDDSLLCVKPYSQIDMPDKVTTQNGFDLISTTLGTSVGSHLYIRSSELISPCTSTLSDKAAKTVTSIIEDDVFTAACDFLVKNDGIVLNGYAIAPDSSDLFKLKYQQPVRNSIINILPYNIGLMLHYGMSYMPLWWGDKIDTLQITALDKKYKVNIADQFANNISEIAMAVMPNNNDRVVVARLDDPAAIIKFMSSLDAAIGVNDVHNTFGCSVKMLNINDLAPKLFGKEFADINKFCYSVVDQYLVVANKTSVVDEVIDCYRSGRTLDLNENFRAFQNNMLEEANLTLYMPLCDNIKYIESYLTEDLRKALNAHKTELDAFQAMSIQMLSARNLIYTSVFLRKQQAVNQESRVIWKTALDAPLQTKPFIFTDYASKCRNIVVFDNLNNAYLIDANGTIKWKKAISEPILGEVKVVDCYGNGRQQFIFNTPNYLHIINREGEYVEGFPMRLPVEMSNGLSVFDYQGTKDYRILLCGTDKLVYNFNVKGNEVEGWNRHRTDNLVVKPVEHLVADNKDYLIITDTQGTVRILDRQGRVRVPLVGDLQKSPTSDIYVNKTNNKGVMLTSDKNGKLLYITSDGRTATTDFGDFGENHFFLYEDFNQDSNVDFIYLDGKELHIFDKFKNNLFSYTFKDEIRQKPAFFNITQSRRLLGIISEASREIYLIDKRGKMVSASGIVGETPFAVGSLLNNNVINLVTGVGDNLYNYSIK